MNKVVLCAVLIFLAATAPVLSRATQSTPTRSSAGTDVASAAFLKQYCLSCHNSRAKLGGLALDTLDVGSVEGHADVWEKVVRKLRTGMMPPEGAPKPPAAVREMFSSALET